MHCKFQIFCFEIFKRIIISYLIYKIVIRDIFYTLNTRHYGQIILIITSNLNKEQTV